MTTSPQPRGDAAALVAPEPAGGPDRLTEAADRPTGDTDLAERVWRGLRTLVHEKYDRRKEVSDLLGMSFVRIKALRRLARESMTMRQLAATLTTDAPYTTIIVDDLERRGLVERTIHPEDRRRRIVTATPAGKKAADAAEHILKLPPAPLRDVDAADLAVLDRVVTALLAAEGDGG